MSKELKITLTPEQRKQVLDYEKNKPYEEVYYSIVKASEVLKVNKSTLFRYINDGLIAKIIIGKSPKITLTEINRFLNKKP